MNPTTARTLTAAATPRAEASSADAAPAAAAAHHAQLAWAAVKVDGHLHVDQWRALVAVLARYKQNDRDDAPQTAEAALEALLEARDALDPTERRALFATAAWVALSDGRAHGQELWLLCEVRRALELDVASARRLLSRVAVRRRRAAGPPARRELDALHADLRRLRWPAPPVVARA